MCISYIIYNVKLISYSCNHVQILFLVYKFQQESPKPQPVFASSAVSGCPFFYGLEYHGTMNHKEANSLLKSDGNYLIRLSTSSDDKTYTLSLKYITLHQLILKHTSY